jgi:hypothetical protein
MEGEVVRNIRWSVAVMAVVIWGATAQPANASVFGDLFGGSCPEWVCGANSPFERAVTGDSATPRPVRANSIFRTILSFFGLRESGPRPGGCEEFGCGSNSPIIDGAAIEAPAAPKPGSIGRPTRANSIIRTILCLLGLCVREPTGGGGGCDDEFGCTGNSPIVDGAAIESEATREAPAANRSFHELHMGGLPNAAGFAVLGVRKGTTAYTVEGAGESIAARPQSAGAPRLEGASLVDLVFDLRDGADRRYTLRIAATDTTRFWAEPQGSVRTYVLTHSAVTGSTPRPLCTTGVNEAILFAGDRYDSLDKSVVATGAAASGWINVACAGTALAKLYLTRHTEASQIVVTTRGERQAMFKMFTADVCGDGTSFTVHGQPLLWADAKGITKFASAPASIEAIWNDTGAVCLDTPRRPQLASSIAARCRRPSCGGATTPAGRGHAISANPR